MCLLVLNKPGAKLTFKEFQDAWATNPDGFGMVILNKNPTVFKSKNFTESWVEYGNALLKNKTLVIHFRMATSGGVDEKLIHPFDIWKDAYLFHNGVLTYDIYEGESDTSSLALDIKYSGVKPMSVLTTKYLENLVDNYNKFIITEKEKYKIIGEELGVWRNKNLWLSNQYWDTSEDIWNWYYQAQKYAIRKYT